MDQNYDEEEWITEDSRNRADVIEEEKKPGFFRSLLENVLYFGMVFLAAFLFVTFVAQRTEVSGTSMYDTLNDHDQLIVDKISYRLNDPERFDVVVFRFQGDETGRTFYIKRIIGLPGETVQIIGSDIYINGEILEEDYGYEPILRPGLAAEPITLGEDEYFVLGDNRNNSTDSRKPSVANVDRSLIIGKAWVRIWPFSDISFVE